MSLGPTYRFSGPTRRAIRALVEGVAPEPEGPAHTEEWRQMVTSVTDRCERLVGFFPWHLRRGLVLGVWFLQWGAPIMGWGIRPLTMLPPEARHRRLEQMVGSRLRPIRLLFTSLRVMTSLGVYSEPSVEARMGVDRRGWRRARQAFRARLLAADAERASLPPTPLPLGTEGVVDPERYLQ